MSNVTKKPRSARSVELGIIHKGAAQIGFITNKRDPRRADWEAFLHAHQAGATSSAELDAQSRAEVIASLKRRGADVWLPGRAPAKKRTNRFGKPLDVSPDKQPLINKINAILADHRLPWDYVKPMVKNLGADDVRFLEPAQLHKLVGMLQSQLPAKRS